MSFFFYFIGTIMLLMAIALAGYLFWILTRPKEDPENETILINFMAKYSDGYSQGIIDSCDEKEGITRIVFYPRDLNYIRMKKSGNKVIKPLTIFVSSKNIVHLPVGSFSSYRNVILAFPPKIEALQEKVKEQSFGKYMMKMIGENEHENEEVKLLRRRIKNQAGILEMSEGMDIARDGLEKLTEINKDLIRQSRVDTVPPKKEE